ncbi:hypothetical protein FHX44_115461 [Pseudonocardia hierapolitana]|uniref:Uncharacterized protein n=1 Tax=Pseudonocardia hierapolitana TaxID=1128676 RepID=A0A561SXD5_9PSEU|nr:DUF6223 family protein [Pseudonocardia hierapolitana]TWF79528.1 hypothetical protein FHX44_115461 [Pseudonocardia hierapolitana]
MSSVHLLLSAPETAHATVAAGGYVLGVGRTVPTSAAVLALAGVVVGGWALARPGDRRAVPITALVMGLIGVVVGGVHGANAAGGLGTGNGLAGAVIAVVLGLVGVVLAGLALARSRRIHRRGPIAGSKNGPAGRLT